MPIPRIFHRYWTGPPMPEAFVWFGEGWKIHHLMWSVMAWDDQNIPPLRNQDLFDRADELAPGFSGQLRSDILRLELLSVYGGVWIDTDFECLKPIDPLLDGVSCFCAWERQATVANNAIIGAVPDHPFIARLIKNLPDSVFLNDGRRPSVMSGPRFLTRELIESGGGNVTVFPEKWFYPYRCDELDRAGEHFPDAYAVHHWGNQRRLRRKPL